MPALLSMSSPDTSYHAEAGPGHGQWPSAHHLASVAGAALFVADLDPEERRDALPGLLRQLQSSGSRAMLEEVARALGHLAARDAIRSAAGDLLRTGWLGGQDLSGGCWSDLCSPVMKRLLEVLSPSTARCLPRRHELMDGLRRAHSDAFDATVLEQLAR